MVATLGIIASGIVFERPWAAALYVLPLAVLLLSLRRDQPREVLIGTARFFPPDEATSGSRTKRQLTPDRIAAIAALVCAVTALLGPRPAPAARGSDSFALLVDRSPSMYLEHDPRSGRADRRIDVAIEAALAALEDHSIDVELVWLDGGREIGTGPEPPDELLEPPRPGRDEPLFEAFDREGVLWVTDAPTGAWREHAGIALSGGEAVPGPVAVTPDGTRVWTADGRIIDAGSGAPRPRVRIAAGVEPLFVRFAELWARERDLEVTSEDSARDVELEIVPAPKSPSSTALEARPGRVEVSGAVRESALRDPAAFAVTWSERLDAAILPPEGVVSIDERREAGAVPEVALPAQSLARSLRSREAAEQREERGHRAMAGGLALATALFGALAVYFVARRSRGAARSFATAR